MKEKVFKFITKLKILKDRSVGWVSMLNLFMIASLYLKDYHDFTFLGFNSITILIVGIVGIIFLTLLDFIFILPREQEYYLSVNAEWNREIKKGVKK